MAFRGWSPPLLLADLAFEVGPRRASPTTARSRGRTQGRQALRASPEDFANRQRGGVEVVAARVDVGREPQRACLATCGEVRVRAVRAGARHDLVRVAEDPAER